jgi:hypothetical protein
MGKPIREHSDFFDVDIQVICKGVVDSALPIILVPSLFDTFRFGVQHSKWLVFVSNY